MNESFMSEAIQLAVDSARNQGGPFGAVIVRDGLVVARGINRVTATLDPTAHAEVMAIREACARLGSFALDRCEIYASCEPCPMCLGAIYWARIQRLYFAAGREDAAEAGFDDALLYHEIGLPTDRRKLETRRMMSEEGRQPFDAWKLNPSRRAY